MVTDREELIRSFFPLVKRIARRIARMVPGSDADDLVGDGSVGLIRAVDSYDPTRGPTMRAYVSTIVAGSMLNGLRRLDPVSERVRREIRDAERERFSIAGEDGAMPTQGEMEARRPKLRRACLHAYRYAPLSLDAPLPAEESFGADWSGDPAEIAADRFEAARLRGALVGLTKKQRRVVVMYYFQSLSLYEIGRLMAISPQRASQLHVAALGRLRKVFYAPSVG